MIEYSARKSMEWSRLSSRVVFGNVLDALLDDHPNCVVITADVASSAGMKDLMVNHPNQFFNVGIAEMNMVGIATGMAECGKNVLITSFAPFASMRCFEAIRSYVGYMHANVKIIGLASGLSMGVGGNTHFGLEDVAIMRTIPGMVIESPADCTETVKTIEAALNYTGPMYIRLTGVNGNPIVYKEDYDFQIGKANVLRTGEDIAIVASGMMVNESLRAAKVLSKSGFSVTVVDMHTIKPLDEDCIQRLCETHNYIVTIEEHTKIGGLGSAVSELKDTRNLTARHLTIGLEDAFGESGTYAYLQDVHGLTAKKIAEKINTFVGGRKE